MPMMSDEPQTAVRRSRWTGQPGQEIRRAETVPDEDDEDDMGEEDDLDEADLEEEDLDEGDLEEAEDEEEES